MKTLFKYFGYLVSFLIVAVLFIGVAGYFYFKSGLPEYQGQVTTTWLKSKVTITRDEYALPHIVAETSENAYFAIGYAHAQDRLWQMNLHRHIAMGRLSELVGEQGLNTDRFLRMLGVYQAAESSYDLLSDQVKTQLDAYSAGVNAFIAEDHILPIEFTILGLGTPEAWQPMHSVAWMKIMAWDLNSTWRKELDRLVMSANFTPAQIAQYHAAYPGDDVFTPPNPEELYGFKFGTNMSENAKRPHAEVKISELIDSQTTQGIGSNNWVLSGKLSQTGKPLLANDPHLALTAPALWYHAHLKATDGSLNVIGATMPGVPYVILGHNDKIAWGFTNTDPDAQDLYVEKITRDGFYKTPDGEAPFIIRKEILKVKGGDDIIFESRSTRHGPVISDLLGDDVKTILGKEHVLALRWTALDNDSRSLEAAAGLGTAQNWDEFIEATRHFKAPEQSIVYADIEGNIGFIAPGAVPVRHADNELYGQYPSPGWVAKYDWQGYIPFEELPQKFNPAKGYIATANHKIVDKDYKHHIASKWTLPYRFDRISKLIEAKPKHTLDTLQAIQLDQYSIFLENMRPLLDQALLIAPLEDKEAQTIYDMIKNWDGRATVQSREMLIYTLWIKNLQRVILNPEFAEARSRNHLFLEEVMSNKNGMSKWCGDIQQQDGSLAKCAELASVSFYITTQQLAQEMGSDVNEWQWGKVHQSVGAHRIFDKVAPLNRFFNLYAPVGGGKTTINVGSHSSSDATDLNKVFRNTHGPSLRHLFDLSDLEKSRYIHSSGQSGNVFSPYYDDYLPRWAAGQFIPMVMNEVNYMPKALGTLDLLPSN